MPIKSALAKHLRKYHRLTDGIVEAMHEFAEGEPRMLYDLDVRGLRVRVGKRTITWAFFKEHRINGRRSTTCKRLGFYPEMDTNGRGGRP
jgi:hypothetical protein